MTQLDRRPAAFLLGALAAVLCLGVLGFRPPQRVQKWEYKLTYEHDEDVVEELGDEGWDYAGFLGESPRGGGEAIGLWQRPK